MLCPTKFISYFHLEALELGAAPALGDVDGRELHPADADVLGAGAGHLALVDVHLLVAT